MPISINCACGKQYVVEVGVVGADDKCPNCGRPPRFSVQMPGVPVADEFEVKYGGLVYRGPRPFEELEFPLPSQTEIDDSEWAMRDPQVKQEYCGRVVAVHRRKVWGVGNNDQAAWEQASKTPGCPPFDELVFVLV